MTTTLYPTWTLGSLELTSYPFAVEFDGDHGAPETISELVTSMLADGDLVRQTRHGNREISIVVVVEGATLGDLADNEATLRRECLKPRNALTFDPGDIDSPASVFEVQMVEMRQPRDEAQEAHLMRRWELTLTCAPFARSADLVTIPALDVPAGSATTVSVNTADSAAGWGAQVTSYSRSTEFTTLATTVTDIGAGIAITPTGTNVSLTCTLGSSAVALSGTPYLVIDMAGPAPARFEVQATGGVRRVPVVMTRATTYPSTQYVLEVGDTTLYDVRMSWASPDPFGNRYWPVNVYDITATDSLPVITSHQASRIIETGGTERTPASIEVAPRVGGETLKLTIVHTSPRDGSGNSPALRQYRASGNTVTGDTSRISGAREPVLVNPIVAQMPLLSVPEGEYVLAALMRSDIAGTFPITWQARTFFSGSYLSGGVVETVSAKFTDAGFWTIVPLGVVTLPPVRAAAAEAFVELTLNRSPLGGANIDLDEWWAFRHGDGCALTMVASGNTSFLWLDSPDITSPVPRVWIGSDGDRSDARHPGPALIAQGNHHLHPGGTTIFVASEGISNAAVSATYHKRWHSNAAE